MNFLSCHIYSHLHLLTIKFLEMKKLPVTFLLTVLSIFLVNAQAVYSNGPKRENYMGYMIKILPVSGNGYGYDLFFKGMMVVHEPINPFTMSPLGLSKKEDALRVAHWQIEQFWRKGNHVLPRQNIRISPDVAERLKIESR
jgi:hypothetical protein